MFRRKYFLRDLFFYCVHSCLGFGGGGGGGSGWLLGFQSLVFLFLFLRQVLSVIQTAANHDSPLSAAMVLGLPASTTMPSSAPPVLIQQWGRGLGFLLR